MQIYGSILSPFTARVVLAARFKGLKYTISYPDGGAKTPKFLKMNPLGKLPILVDGKVTLFESGVILEYLDAKSRKNRLIPSAAKAAAKARLIAAVLTEYLQPQVLPLFMQRDPATRNQAAVDAAIAESNKVLDVLEGLIGKPLAIGKFSLADCYAVPAICFLEMMMPLFGVTRPLGERPKLNAYRAQIAKNKITGAVLAEMNQEMRERVMARP